MLGDVSLQLLAQRFHIHNPRCRDANLPCLVTHLETVTQKYKSNYNYIMLAISVLTT